MTNRLYINNVQVDLSESIPFPISYSIADFKEPDKRRRSSSKTITLEGTKVNKQVFSSAYQLSLTDFDGQGLGFFIDPTVRVEARYIKNGKEIFNGLCQLLEVKKLRDNYKFEIVLFSNFINIFQEWGDVKVSELGWKEYDHVIDKDNIEDSWSTSIIKDGVATSNYSGGKPQGFGYWYPLIDFGYNNGSNTFDVVDLVPYVYQKEIIEKAFALANVSIDSDFIESDMFKALVFGFGGGKKQNVEPVDKANRQVNYSFDGTYQENVNNALPILHHTDGSKTYHLLSSKRIPLSQFTESLITDGYGQYDDTTGTIRMLRTGRYSLNLDFNISLDSVLSPSTQISGDRKVEVKVLKNGSLVQNILLGQIPSSLTYYNIDTDIDLSLQAGDYVDVIVEASISITVKTSTTPSFMYTIDLNNDFTIDLTAVNGQYNAGDIITLSRFIPDMKVSDFVKGVITMFNLYVDEQNEYGLVKIEPLIDFYGASNEAEDWTHLKDESREESIKPTNIQGKTYSFRFEEDLDYYKNLYKELIGDNYGDYNYEVKNTYQKGEKEFKVPFAQTCPVEQNGVVMPKIIQRDEANNTFLPYKGKPRIFFNNGLVAGSFSLLENGTLHTFSSYPQAHHGYGNFKNISFDLNFGKPEQVFFSYNTYNNENIFNNYHRLFINELTNRDSKIYKAYFKLDESNIYSGMFRTLVKINGVLYRKNIIIDFDATGKTTTQVELLKVIETQDPVINTPSVTIANTNLQNFTVINGGYNEVLQEAPIMRSGLNSQTQRAEAIVG